MNKKLFFVIWVFILCIFNIPYLKSFYYNLKWKEFFNDKKYALATKEFNHANNIEWTYNLWNTFYKQWNYKKSIQIYSSILWQNKNDMNYRLYHNIGNAYYKYWEKQTNLNLKIWYYENAINKYKNALDIKYNKQTKDNLLFVLNKLQKLKETQKKQWQKNNTKQWNWKRWQQKRENWKNEKQWKKNWNKQNWQKNNTKQWNWKKNNTKQWNNEVFQELKKYQKNLIREQENNIQYYWKVYKSQNNEDPFFTNMNIDNNKKDW